MSDWLLADDINRMIDDLVSDKGLKALDHNGHTHFYSMPYRDVLRKISGIKINNHGRALKRAPQLGATLIDDTLVGKFLTNFKGMGNAVISGKGTFDYFDVNPIIDDVKRSEQALATWKHASRYFALASWGYVSTSICGASRWGVCCSIETPYSINPEHPTPTDMSPLDDALKALFVPRKTPVAFINLVPFARVADGYTPTNWEPAHDAARSLAWREVRYHPRGD